MTRMISEKSPSVGVVRKTNHLRSNMTLHNVFHPFEGKSYDPIWIGAPVCDTIQVCKPIHTGGQAYVCKVNGGGSFYALKVFKRNKKSPEVPRSMNAEIRATFDNPFFIQPISQCQISRVQKAILFPWIEGTTLNEFIKGENLSNDEKLDLMIEISQALEYLHAQGWKHNDLKPTNIMVVDSNTTPKIRIIDFALASETDQDLDFEGNHNMFGKPEWVAPELYLQGHNGGIKNASKKSDVWALGCLLLFIQTGMDLWDFLDFRPGFSHSDFIDFCKDRRDNNQSIIDLSIGNSTIDIPLRNILMQCLETRRDDRPTTQQVVATIRLLRNYQ